jgi:predicted metal-binding protein
MTDKLIDMALRAGRGVFEAALIPVKEIEVSDNLAKICRDPGCPNYGASPGCPPNVAGPNAFREWLKEAEQAIFIKIEVPMESLLSFEYREIMRLLHEVVADIEQEAVSEGYTKAKGFAGGSCKELFCGTYTDCNVLERKSKCRNPGRPRPSMSGFGVNVTKLKDLAGWNHSNCIKLGQSDEEPLGAVYGLILVG